ncbi:hypothetical protein D3C85_1766160 [compost metagenome]
MSDDSKPLFVIFLGAITDLASAYLMNPALHDQPFDYDWKPAPRVAPDMSYVHYQSERRIRVYRDIDVRFILEDMYAKLALFTVENI